jgi:hypothetical protein
MSGFNRDVNEVFVLLGCYAGLVGSYRLLGTVYRSVISLSVCHQSISPSVYQSISPSVYQSISPSVHQSISLSVHQSISPSVYHSISLSVHHSISLSVHQSISLSVPSSWGKSSVPKGRYLRCVTSQKNEDFK